MPPRPLRLTGPKISGFHAVPTDRCLSLPAFGHRTVFIDQNDCGKSLPFRFLQQFVPVAKAKNQLVFTERAGSIVSDSFWRHDKTGSIRVDLAFTSPADDIQQAVMSAVPRILLIKDGRWWLRVTLRFADRQHNPEVGVTGLQDKETLEAVIEREAAAGRTG